MPTATRTPRRAPAPSRRSPAPGRYARAAAHRGQGLRRRKPPEPTGIKKVLGSVLPGAAAKKAAPSSKKGKAGGLALAAAAAGMAFKNRGKLSELRHRDRSAAGTSTEPGVNNAGGTPPASPTV